MRNYIDGFAFPIAVEHLGTYQQIAAAVAEIYRELGAVEYVEFVGDDLAREGTARFPVQFQAGDNETIVFGWIAFESRESRDAINQKIEADPRIPELIAPLLNSNDPIFNPLRMAFGGFRPLVHNPD